MSHLGVTSHMECSPLSFRSCRRPAWIKWLMSGRASGRNIFHQYFQTDVKPTMMTMIAFYLVFFMIHIFYLYSYYSTLRMQVINDTISFPDSRHDPDSSHRTEKTRLKVTVPVITGVTKDRRAWSVTSENGFYPGDMLVEVNYSLNLCLSLAHLLCLVRTVLRVWLSCVVLVSFESM